MTQSPPCCSVERGANFITWYPTAAGFHHAADRTTELHITLCLVAVPAALGPTPTPGNARDYE